MPRVNQNITDEPLVPKEVVIPQIVIGSTPMFVASVLRRANVGNFEHIDVSATLALPIPIDISQEDIEVLRQAVKDTASEAFTNAAREASSRYNDIKELRNADRGRPTEAAE
jgi:hypothetical protein